MIDVDDGGGGGGDDGNDDDVQKACAQASSSSPQASQVPGSHKQAQPASAPSRPRPAKPKPGPGSQGGPGSPMQAQARQAWHSSGRLKTFAWKAQLKVSSSLHNFLSLEVSSKCFEGFWKTMEGEEVILESPQQIRVRMQISMAERSDGFW